MRARACVRACICVCPFYRRERGWTMERAPAGSALSSVTPTDRRGFTPERRTDGAAVPAQRGIRELRGGKRTRTHVNARARTHTHASFRRNLVHGEICGDGVATQAGMEAFLRRVQSRLGVSPEPSEYHNRSRMRVFMNETRTLCYRLRSCC